MSRRITLPVIVATVVGLAACHTPTAPNQREPQHNGRVVPSVSTTSGCDSTSTSADSTDSCRGPYIPWY